MPNWVFNHIDRYSEDLYNKYSNEEENLAIDFNKVIPEPEEIKNTISGSYNKIAKDIVAYKNYTPQKYRSIKYDSENPLKDTVKNIAESTCIEMGELAIENPNKTLNNILSENINHYHKKRYDDYINIFGNRRYSSINDKDELKTVFENYCKIANRDYQNFKNNEKIQSNSFLPDTIEEYGEYLNNCKEKYGFDNWYDWRNANWGTKWNACESDYDKESESLHFDTAWSIPYPILTKIAHDNPNTNFDGYSEEETGWFDEYNAHNGKINITCHGELEYDDNDQITENREESNEVLEYPSYLEQSIRDWKKFTEIKLNNII